MATSEIIASFDDQTLFITGGTGFLGKMLIEKLLRVCEPRKIYVLVRPKKGKTAEERADAFFDYPCFERVKADYRDIKGKICFINGDCSQTNLGLSPDEERLLIQEATIVIHAAANVKFDQTLESAANANVRSTVNIMTLANKMAGLKAFVYVSTAYSNSIYNEIKETFYPPPMTYQQLLPMVEGLDEEKLNQITPTLLDRWPNTYIYTKCISENVVNQLGQNLPIAVVRPAIVITTMDEPMPGWIDNFYGVIGIAMGGGLGIIRSFRMDTSCIAHLVPVDFVSNLVLASIWDTQRKKDKGITIYNFADDKANLLTWGRFHEILSKFYKYIPDEKVIWYYTFTARRNKRWNAICVFFTHTLPAYVIDAVLFCIGKPTVAVKAYRKLNHALELISYFTTGSWVFDDGNTKGLWGRMGEEDRKLFNFNMADLEWEEVCRRGFFGAVPYLLKLQPKAVPKSTFKAKFLFVAHYTVVFLFWFLVYKLVMFVLSLFL